MILTIIIFSVILMAFARYYYPQINGFIEGVPAIPIAITQRSMTEFSV